MWDALHRHLRSRMLRAQGVCSTVELLVKDSYMRTNKSQYTFTFPHGMIVTHVQCISSLDVGYRIPRRFLMGRNFTLNMEQQSQEGVVSHTPPSHGASYIAVESPQLRPMGEIPVSGLIWCCVVITSLKLFHLRSAFLTTLGQRKSNSRCDAVLSLGSYAFVAILINQRLPRIIWYSIIITSLSRPYYGYLLPGTEVPDITSRDSSRVRIGSPCSQTQSDLSFQLRYFSPYWEVRKSCFGVG